MTKFTVEFDQNGRAFMAPVYFDSAADAAKFVRDWNAGLEGGPQIETTLDEIVPEPEPEPVRLSDENGKYINRSSEETRRKQSESAKAHHAKRKGQEPGESCQELIERLAPAVVKDVEDRERNLLKAEFAAEFRKSGLAASRLNKEMGKGNGWVENRKHGRGWPTREEIELLKSTIAKLSSPPGPKAEACTMDWTSAFKCIVMLAEGDDHARALAKLQNEDPWSHWQIGKVATIAIECAQDIDLLRKAMNFSNEDFNKRKIEVQGSLKARGKDGRIEFLAGSK